MTAQPRTAAGRAWVDWIDENATDDRMLYAVIKNGPTVGDLRRLVLAIEAQAATGERNRMVAMRLDFRNLPHREFWAKWPDRKEYEEVLPSSCGCQDCRLWRSGS